MGKLPEMSLMYDTGQAVGRGVFVRMYIIILV